MKAVEGTKPAINVWGCIYRSVLLAALAMGVLFFATGGGCSTLTNWTSDDSQITTDITESLSEGIKESVIELKYSEGTARDFVGMVAGWRSGNSRPVLAVWKRELIEAEQNYKCGEIDSVKKSRVERRIAIKLCERIRREISVDDEVFELQDVIRYEQAQCLGYSQLYYALGRALGLAVRPINVVKLEGRRRLGAGVAHVSCMVDLSDGRTMMLDLVPGGFISRPFVFGDKFKQVDNCRQINDDCKSLKIFRKVEVLSAEGLAAHRYNNLGSVYSFSERLDDAELSYSRAIELNPNFAEAYNNRGVAKWRSGRGEEALRDYSKAIELRPEYAEAWNNRAITYEKKGELERAISDYTRAIELKPDCAQAYNNRANAYAKLRKFEKAITDYDHAIRRDSRLAQAYGNRALSFAAVGKLKGAKEDLLKAVQLNPQLRSYASRMSERFDLGLSLDGERLFVAK